MWYAGLAANINPVFLLSNLHEQKIRQNLAQFKQQVQFKDFAPSIDSVVSHQKT